MSGSRAETNALVRKHNLPKSEFQTVLVCLFFRSDSQGISAPRNVRPWRASASTRWSPSSSRWRPRRAAKVPRERMPTRKPCLCGRCNLPLRTFPALASPYPYLTTINFVLQTRQLNSFYLKCIPLKKLPCYVCRAIPREFGLPPTAFPPQRAAVSALLDQARRKAATELIDKALEGLETEGGTTGGAAVLRRAKVDVFGREFGIWKLLYFACLTRRRTISIPSALITTDLADVADPRPCAIVRSLRDPSASPSAGTSQTVAKFRRI